VPRQTVAAEQEDWAGRQLAQEQAQAAGTVGRMPNSSTFQLAGMPPTRKTAGGEARVAGKKRKIRLVP